MKLAALLNPLPSAVIKFMTPKISFFRKIMFLRNLIAILLKLIVCFLISYVLKAFSFVEGTLFSLFPLLPLSFLQLIFLALKI